MKACFIINFQLSNVVLQKQLQAWVSGCDSLEHAECSEQAQLHVWDWNQFSACTQAAMVLPKNLIIFSDTFDEKREQRVLQSGALDYICEPFHLDNVFLRLSQHVQRVRYVAQLENLSVTDTLTELFNRRKFNQDLDRCWRQNMRQKSTSSLLLIDVDHFKKFNDQYGHVAGDQCLYKLAQVFKREAVRPHDIAARIGGEEFAIILPQTPKEGAMHVAKRILEGVQALKIENAQTQLGLVTISVGLASASTQMSIEQWQKSADDALYQAKHSGRNRVIANTDEALSNLVSEPDPV